MLFTKCLFQTTVAKQISARANKLSIVRTLLLKRESSALKDVIFAQNIIIKELVEDNLNKRTEILALKESLHGWGATQRKDPIPKMETMSRKAKWTHIVENDPDLYEKLSKGLTDPLPEKIGDLVSRSWQRNLRRHTDSRYRKLLL